ncbi:MAG: Holliday junction branch migration protein RuvA [Candidatus Hydrothermota bacterium]|nr:MAG: Holliday junction branch migration protein RuvA [Candidatus Hydrothermae bacterium]
MLYSVEGRLLKKSPFRVVVEVNGISFEIFIPVSAFEALPPEGNNVKLFVYPIVQENRIVLYGFTREAERELFLELIRLTGVGPALAMRVLSGLSAEEFVEAVKNADVDVISRVKGVGKRRAERIIFEMVGKTAHILPQPVSREEDTVEKAVQALVALGLKEAEARSIVRKVIDEAGKELAVEDIIRIALGGHK